MSLLKREEDSVYARGAFDSPANQNSRSNKKRQTIIDTWREPLWPRLSRILLIGMIALSVAMSLVEVKNATLAPAFDAGRFLSNLSMTLLWVWGVCTVFLAACCFAGMRANRRGYERRKLESGIVDETEEDRACSRRAVQRLNRSYLLCLRISLIGLSALILLFAVVRLFRNGLI